VVALGYYANVAKEMWMNPTPDGDDTPVRVPVSLSAALAITAVLTLAFGVTQWATELGDVANVVAAGLTP
jgi:NADH-quinone oxidoreductase subunit N